MSGPDDTDAPGPAGQAPISRRRRRRRGTSAQGAPPAREAPSDASPAGAVGADQPTRPPSSQPDERPSTDEAPQDRPNRRRAADAKPGRRTRPTRDSAERGLRDLVGAGSSQVGIEGALRARDVNRPTDEDLAEAEATVVVMRRHWTPPPSGAK